MIVVRLSMFVHIVHPSKTPYRDGYAQFMEWATPQELWLLQPCTVLTDRTRC